MAQALHDNFLSAKNMVEESMDAPTKTVKYLPIFLRVFPTRQIQIYKEQHNSALGNLRSQYCTKSCVGMESDCQNKCESFYSSYLAQGLQIIRKVHKQYKVQAVQEDDE